MSDDFQLEFPITMLGARGVGKTSMIAAMWNEFDRICDDPALELLPDKTTEKELTEKLKALKAVASGASRVIEQGEGIKGNDTPLDYTLDFFHTVSRAKLHIIFRDYPGAWLDQESQKFHRIVSKLADARIILVAIDVPSLMDSDEHNKEKNRPDDVAAAIAEAFKKGTEQERLVLFVLMRGERWLRDKQGQKVLERFTKQFSKATGRVNAYKNSMAAVVCPIQTLGAVRFVQFGSQNEAIFEKIGNEAYRPVDCDQPLRYAMSFMTQMLEQYATAQQEEKRDVLNKRKWWERVKDSTLGLFGVKSAKRQEFDEWLKRSTSLRASVSKFATGCKQNEMFQVLHSPQIIGVKKTL